MCYNSKSILNKSRVFDINRDSFTINVPCNKCGECRSSQQRAFEVRNYYEFCDTILHDGFVFFDTFTYDQVHVPKDLGFLTFESRHYKKFMHDVRETMKEEYGFDPYRKVPVTGEWIGNPEHSLKVFWASEYGGQTKRPHYHALFFVRFDFGVSSVEERLLRFQDILDRCWTYGRTDRRWCERHFDNKLNKYVAPSGILSKLVNAKGAISYVSKYVTKDFDFEAELENQKYALPEFGTEKEYKSFLKRVSPFHRQSNGIGLAIKDYCDPEDIRNGKIWIPDDESDTLHVFPHLHMPIRGKLVPLPEYIDRKLFYDYNPEDKCFRLSKLGAMVKTSRYKHNRDYNIHRLSTVYNNMNQYLNEGSKEFLNSFGYNGNNVISEINNLLGDRTISDLAIYSTCFRDRHVSTDLDISRDIDISVFTRNDNDILYYQRNLVTSDRNNKLHEYKLLDSYIETYKTRCDDKYFMYRFYERFRRECFNNLPCFRGFDRLLNIFSLIIYYYNNEQQKKYIEHHQLKSEYKSYLYTSGIKSKKYCDHFKIT